MDEEAELLKALLEARRHLAEHKGQDAIRRLEKAQLESEIEEAQSALVKYMTENGLKWFNSGTNRVTISESVSVDIQDDEAVPDQYCTLKKVPNKKAIKDLFKYEDFENNWVRLKRSPKITVTYKGE